MHFSEKNRFMEDSQKENSKSEYAEEKWLFKMFCVFVIGHTLERFCFFSFIITVVRLFMLSY